MITIHKFALPIATQAHIDMPLNARVLSVGEQRGGLMLWAHVDDTAPMTMRKFYVIGTGHPFPRDLNLAHVGTVQMLNGLVWHVFDPSPIAVRQL